jgi:hypothetical protein
MVSIPPVKIVMTGGWFMALFYHVLQYTHYRSCNYKPIPIINQSQWKKMKNQDLFQNTKKTTNDTGL